MTHTPRTDEATPIRRKKPPVLVEALDEIIVALLEAREAAMPAYTRMMLARNGFPVGGSGGGAGISDPTGAAAQRLADGAERDHGREALVRTKAALVKTQAGARGLLNELEAWTPRQPSERDLEATAEVSVECCVPCHGYGYFAPFYIHSDCKRNLVAPMALCQWTYRWVLRFGTLPNERQVRDHHERGKNRIPA